MATRPTEPPPLAPRRRRSSLPRLFALVALLCLPAAAQAPSPAHWTLKPSTAQIAPGQSFTLELQLQLDAPWHMYSLTTPKPGPTGGPTATTIRLAENPALTGYDVYFLAPARHFDANFNLDTETYEGTVVFLLRGELAKDVPAGPLELTAQLRYQLCTDKECLPPKKVKAATSLEVAPGAAPGALALPAGYRKLDTGAAAPGTAAPTPTPATPSQPAQGLGSFLLLAFGFGLAAVFTPCVFPMIPITMSFFLNQSNGTRAQAIGQALVFSLGVIVLFTAIGFGLSAALGPFAVVQLGSNPWVNGVISAVFFAFALSLLGAFEITLPSGLLTRLNMASMRGGYVGTLLMGLTFCLASFACVGPFMGTLLAASVGGERLQPVLGMAAFSAALSSPFFVLALFPSFLKRLPRSGGWMSRVKVVLGFLLLAALLKYLANIDQVMQWNLLTRERFLAFWVVLFILPGLYLLGFLRLEGVERDERVGTGRLLVAIALIGFGCSLAPGLVGVRLGEIEAYIPAPAESAPAAAGSHAGVQWMKNDFAGAVARAKAENKLVLVAFTGYACTNCHWMKANLFTRPEIAAALEKLVLVELYTDGTDPASEQNQRLQEKLFQSVAIPYYALFDGDEKPVASLAGLTKDAPAFLRFLETQPAVR